MPKSTFSEFGHVAYQIKRNEAYNNMLVNILPQPLVGVKRSFFIFSESSNVSNQINENAA